MDKEVKIVKRIRVSTDSFFSSGIGENLPAIATLRR